MPSHGSPFLRSQCVRVSMHTIQLVFIFLIASRTIPFAESRPAPDQQKAAPRVWRTDQCGIKFKQCCKGDKPCQFGLACNEGTCSPCGRKLYQVCCPGNECPARLQGIRTECSDGRCIPCGQAGQLQCRKGRPCDSKLTVDWGALLFVLGTNSDHFVEGSCVD